MSARIVALHLKGAKGARPAPVDEVTARVGGGIHGDRHVDKAERGVVIVDRSTLDDLGFAPGDLREQITLEGVPNVSGLEPGTLIRAGRITLRVNGPCAPCTHIGEMNGVADPESLRQRLVGRRGATCTVVEATGPARVGDRVDVMSRVAAS